MVNNYKRKTKQCAWTEKEMKSAMAEAAKTSIARASRLYNIPLGTLHRHIKKGSAKKKLGRFSMVFSPGMEQEIVEYAKELDVKFYGLTRESLQKLAYQLAEKNNIEHPFQNNKAGRAWVEGFMKRNPQLAFRSPEPTSIARCAAFNRRKVGEFFDNLSQLYERHNFLLTPTSIYNMDETGVKTSASKPPKLISVKGKKQVGVISSAEKGELTTIICCVNAAGSFVPPAFIFGKRKKVGERMLDSGPIGSKGWCSDSGWINAEIFLEWLKFFIRVVRPSIEQPVLLILDNHNSHLNLNAIELAREKGVVMLSVPPHTTHKLQPLDVTVFRSFKGAFEIAVDVFQKNYPGRRINQHDIPSLVKTAFEKCSTVQIITSGFKKCGICPFNRDVFTDLDFAPSDVHFISEDNFDNVATVLPNETLAMQETSSTVATEESMKSSVTNSVSPSCPKVAGIEPNGPTSPQPSYSGGEDAFNVNVELSSPKPLGTPLKTAIATRSSPQPSCSKDFFAVSPKEILPLPRAQKSVETQRRKRCQKSEILTSSPFKSALEAKRNIKDSKRNLLLKTGKCPQKIKISKPKPPEEPEPTDNVLCLICSEPYSNSKSKEVWIQCNICEQWAHKLCTNYNSGVFICDFCKDDVCSKLK